MNMLNNSHDQPNRANFLVKGRGKAFQSLVIYKMPDFKRKHQRTVLYFDTKIMGDTFVYIEAGMNYYFFSGLV